jgi:hypothetical protein
MLAEIIQGIVALTLVVGDIVLHAKNVPADGFDSFVTVVVAVYIGGKVAQQTQTESTKATIANTNATNCLPQSVTGIPVVIKPVNGEPVEAHVQVNQP